MEEGAVFIEENGWRKLAEVVGQLKPTNIFVLVDQNTEIHCLPYFSKYFDTIGNFEVIQIPSGEANKNISTCQDVWESLSNKGADRKSLMVNLGGGVVTDLGGFIASTFMRGIPFINIPTSLLAMVDASVGGKTGVDLGSLKNQIGLIQSPKMVVIDSNFLNTLPKEQLVSGMAEMIKHSLIDGEEAWNKQIMLTPEDIIGSKTLIPESIKIKERIVQEDPTEKGIRKILNYGHTIGHAIESHFLSSPDKQPLLHGEAIAIGMILASFLSHELLEFEKQKLDSITSYILSLFPKQDFSKNDIKSVIDLMQFDKKNSGGTVLFVLMKDFGSFDMNKEVNNDLVYNAFEFYKRF